MMAPTKKTKAIYNTEIPSDWEVKKLGRIAKFFSGGTPLTSKPEYYLGNIPFIKSGEIYFDKTEQFISEEGLNFSSAKMVEKGDLLYALYGANSGEVAVSKIKGAINQAILCIRHNDECETAFIYNFLLYQKENIIRTYLQGGQGNLSAEIVKALQIPLPPLYEQKSIAQVLSTADAAIHTTEKLIAQKELQKKWLMQQLLTGRKRLEGFNGEWKEKNLSELFDRVIRKNSEVNTTIVTISAQRGFVLQTDFFNKTIASEITDNYFLVERGEFCYNKSYSNGYPWGAIKRLNDFEKAVVTTLYICFRVKDEKKTSPEFFEQFFGENQLDKGLIKIAHEGGRAHGLLNVTPSDFFLLKVTVPSFQEQTAIANVLQAADKEISLLKAKAEKLRKQKKGLMQLLLTGKVRLKINNSER